MKISVTFDKQASRSNARFAMSDDDAAAVMEALRAVRKRLGSVLSREIELIRIYPRELTGDFTMFTLTAEIIVVGLGDAPTRSDETSLNDPGPENIARAIMYKIGRLLKRRAGRDEEEHKDSTSALELFEEQFGKV